MLCKRFRLCPTCHFLKRAVRLHGEALPVGVQGLVAHLSAVFNWFDGDIQERLGDISTTGNLKKAKKKVSQSDFSLREDKRCVTTKTKLSPGQRAAWWTNPRGGWCRAESRQSCWRRTLCSCTPSPRCGNCRASVGASGTGCWIRMRCGSGTGNAPWTAAPGQTWAWNDSRSGAGRSLRSQSWWSLLQNNEFRYGSVTFTVKAKYKYML